MRGKKVKLRKVKLINGKFNSMYNRSVPWTHRHKTQCDECHISWCVCISNVYVSCSALWVCDWGSAALRQTEKLRTKPSVQKASTFCWQQANVTKFCYISMRLVCQKTHTELSKKGSRMNITKLSNWSYTDTLESCRTSQSHKVSTLLRLRRKLWPELDDHLIVDFLIKLNNTDADNREYPKSFLQRQQCIPRRVSPSVDSHLVSQQFNRQRERQEGIIP